MSCLTDPSAIGPGPSFASPSLAGGAPAGAARTPLQPGGQPAGKLTAVSGLAGTSISGPRSGPRVAAFARRTPSGRTYPGTPWNPAGARPEN